MSAARRLQSRSVALLAAIAAGLMISACSHSGSKATVDNLSSSPAPPGARFEQATLLTAHQVSGLTSLPWRLVAVHLAPPALDIYYVAGGGCTSPRGIEAVQTSSSITIEAAGKTSSAQACPSDLITGYARIPLRQSLGSRHLVHAPVDKHWNSTSFRR